MKTFDGSNWKETINTNQNDSLSWMQPKVFDETRVYESWPVITVTNSKRILINYSSGSVHSRTAQRWIKSVYSDDGGISWSSFDEYGISSRDLSVYSLSTLKNGTVIRIVRSVSYPDTTSVWDHLVQTSTNNGSSWATIATVNASNLSNNPVLIGPICEGQDGTLHAAWHSSPDEGGGTPAAGVLSSKNAGKTWEQTTLISPGSLDNTPVEGRICLLDDGRLLYLSRQQVKGKGFWLSVGNPSGNSWTSFVETNIKDGMLTPPAVLADEGNLFVYYHDRDKNVRRRIKAPQSVVDTPTQFPPSTVYGVVNTNSQWDSGYIHATKNSNGNHETTFYAGFPSQARVFYQKATPNLFDATSNTQNSNTTMDVIATISTMSPGNSWDTGQSLSFSSRGSSDGTGGMFLGAALVPVVSDHMSSGELYCRIIGAGSTDSSSVPLNFRLCAYQTGATDNTTKDILLANVDVTGAANTLSIADSGWVRIPKDAFLTRGNNNSAMIGRYQITIRGASTSGNAKAHAMTTAYVAVKK